MKKLSDAKVFELLSCFRPGEWKRYGAYLDLHGNTDTIILYTLIDKYYPDFEQVPNNRKSFFALLFTDKRPFNDKQLRYLLSAMQQHGERFLAGELLSSDPSVSALLLSNELARRGAAKNFLSLYKDASPAHKDVWAASENYFHHYRKEEAYLTHYLPSQPRGRSNITAAVRNLDLFYLVKKLQLECEITNAANVMAGAYASQLMPELSKAIHSGAYRDVPAVQAWYAVWLTLTAPDDVAHFEKLQQTIQQSEDTFSVPELRDLYQYLMNYCIRKINTGHTTYVPKLLGIYKEILERGVIFTNDYLSQWDYKNIITIGVRSDEMEWTAGFIETYRNKLAPAERANAYTYNKAYLLFNTGKISEALALLRKVEFSDLYYQLDARVILMKCYFVNDDEDAFFYHAAAFRLFLSRNKQVSAYQRTVYRNLLKYTTRILQANNNSQKLKAIAKEIEQNKNIADIGWVKKQLEQAGAYG